VAMSRHAMQHDMAIFTIVLISFVRCSSATQCFRQDDYFCESIKSNVSENQFCIETTFGMS